MDSSTSSPQSVWQAALETIRTKVGEEHYGRWFLPLRPVALSEAALTLEAPNRFFRDWLTEHYGELLREAVGGSRAVELTVGHGGGELSPPAVVPRAASPPAERPALNAKYTFDRFVVGAGNRFAHAASLAVAESPAKAYNPLFIYGGVGMGKTHLLQAIGHAVLERAPSLRLVYISSEGFTNQLIAAIQSRATTRFREKYRAVDLLLVDDIQFIAGKEATQEEFFHTFNALYDAHRQIVISSDRSPKEIADLEERLVSRFEWGLVTDIQPPDLETRIAILRRKASEAGLAIPEETALFVAERIRSNIRELEGALIRVAAFAQFSGRPIMDVALAREVLRDMLVEESATLTIEKIQQRVAEFFQVPLHELRGKRRDRHITYPRHVAMFLVRKFTDCSLPEIGRQFGGRDHTTVLHACDRITQEVARDRSKRLQLEQLASAFQEGAVNPR